MIGKLSRVMAVVAVLVAVLVATAHADTYTMDTLRDGDWRVFLTWEALFEYLKIVCPFV